MADLDRARPGKELVSLANTSSYTSNWSLVYEADIDYVRLSPDTSAVSVVRTRVSGNPSIFATNEFDGADGDELALLDGFTLSFYRGTQSGLSKYRTGSFQSAKSTFYDVGDTNNVPGREIVIAQDLVYNLALGASQSRAVVVFSPATGTTRSYGIGTGVMKTSFKDRDGQPGVEICFTTQQSTWIGTTKTGYMIVDRLGTWYQSSACL